MSEGVRPRISPGGSTSNPPPPLCATRRPHARRHSRRARSDRPGAGLRLHRFKRTADLPRVRKVLGSSAAWRPNLLDVGSGRGVFLGPCWTPSPLPVFAVDRSATGSPTSRPSPPAESTDCGRWSWTSIGWGWPTRVSTSSPSWKCWSIWSGRRGAGRGAAGGPAIRGDLGAVEGGRKPGAHSPLHARPLEKLLLDAGAAR